MQSAEKLKQNNINDGRNGQQNAEQLTTTSVLKLFCLVVRQTSHSATGETNLKLESMAFAAAGESGLLGASTLDVT